MTQETNRFRFLCESLIPSHTSGFGIRLHDGQGIQAAGPQTIEPDPKYPVEGREPRPPVLLSLKDAQLVAQGEDLELELGTGPKPVSYDHGQKS